jgi:hypothetical protein
MSAAGAAWLIAPALVLAGCGQTQVDTAQAVDRLNQQLDSRFNSEPTIARSGAGMRISCPRLVESDSRFECTLRGRLSGAVATIPVRVRGDILVPTSQDALARANSRVANAEGRAAAERAVDDAL